MKTALKTVANSPLTAFRREKGISMKSLGKLFKQPYDKTTVLRWERDGVPLERVVEVEEVTGIPREQLRPDMFRTSSSAGVSQ